MTEWNRQVIGFEMTKNIKKIHNDFIFENNWSTKKCIRFRLDLSLGYVTGGSVTKGANLTLTANDSASAYTITARIGTDNWSSMQIASTIGSNLFFGSSYLSGYCSYDKYFGMSVRCVAES